MGDEWKSYAMRQNIIQQIDEHMRHAPQIAPRSAVELEEQVSISFILKSLNNFNLFLLFQK